MGVGVDQSREDHLVVGSEDLFVAGRRIAVRRADIADEIVVEDDDARVHHAIGGVERDDRAATDEAFDGALRYRMGQ